MKMNPIVALEKLGQSIWLDYIRRDLINSGQLEKMIKEDGLKGMTSNPTIFDQAFASDEEYAEDIAKLAKQTQDIKTIYEALAEYDVGLAADTFRTLYERKNGEDGYVSLEVSPYLANDTNATIEEARRLWKTLDRPNIMIKVPGTKAGLPAISQLISEGININVTLLFSVSRYAEVVDAYLKGLEIRLKNGGALKHIASVASFFLSRIDVLVDPLLEKHIDSSNAQNNLAKKLHGQVAIISAKKAYQIFTDKFNDARFKHLAAAGAQVQRPLWASTSTKDPKYSDVKYVEALIGPQTVNTIPMNTFEAYLAHGKPENRLTTDKEGLLQLFDRLPELNIDMHAVCQQLEEEGVDKFCKSFDALFTTLKEKIATN